MTVKCDHCGRAVPVAPHFAQVSVAHADDRRTIHGCIPCQGNEKRILRRKGHHDATWLALQHAVLDDDRYWEDL